MLVVFLLVGTRRLKLVPERGQVVTEFILGFPRNSIIIDTLGEKDGRRFMPILMTVFFVTLGMNLTGIIPGLQIAGTSVIGIPLIEAVILYVVFIYAGIKKHGGGFFKASLFPPGVPWPLYILLTPVEFVSTFIVRPISLTLRLLMNLVAGHMLLALCWAATQFFLITLLFTAGQPPRPARARHLRLRRRLLRPRALRRAAAGVRHHHPRRHLHPAVAGRRALSILTTTRELARRAGHNHPRKENTNGYIN